MRRPVGTPVLQLVFMLVLCACGVGLDPSERLGRARSNLDAGEVRAALIDLKDLLQRDPNNVEARLLLGEVELAQGDPSAAVRELQLALDGGASKEKVLPLLGQALLAQQDAAGVLARIDPGAVSDPALKGALLRMRGAALLTLHRPAEALQAFEGALKHSPDDLKATLGVANATMEIHGLKPALEIVDRAQRAAPTDVTVTLTRATLLLRDRQFGPAAATFEQAIQLASSAGKLKEQLTGLAGLAEAQLNAGQTDAALRTTERMQELAPPSRVSHFLRARALFLAGQLDEARKLVEELVSRNSADHEAVVLLGAVNYVQGNLEQANMYLSSIVAGDPDNAFARVLLAQVRLRQEQPASEASAADPRVFALAQAKRPGESAASDKSIERGIAAAGTNAEALVEFAAGYLATRQPETAARFLARVPEERVAGYRREFLVLVSNIRQNELGPAREIASDLAAKHPSDGLLQVLAGAISIGAGRYPEARAHLEAARRLAPKNPNALVNLGRVDLLEGKLADAERRFRQALELAPGHPPAAEGLAQLAIAAGKVDAARGWLELAIAKHPTAVQPRIRLAQLSLVDRDFVRAERLARESLVLTPDNPVALNVLGLTLSVSGRYEEGIATLERASAGDASSPTAQFNLARAHLMAAEPQRAEEIARASLQKAPDHLPTLVLLATLSLHEADLAESERLLARMRKLAPEDPRVLLLEGDLQMRKREFAAAASTYQRAARIAPTREVASREVLARQRAGLANAEAPLRSWLEANPSDHEALMALAEAERESGRQGAAAALYERALASRPKDPVILNNLAWLYFEQGDARAVEHARRAYELAPARAEIADTYGWLLVQGGRNDEGIKVLEPVVRAPRSPPAARVHLAVALANQGDNARAQELLAQIDHQSLDEATREAAEQLARDLGARKRSGG
jgi:putative PEP-CTERM system TPR-repeat lipoprotein